MCKIQIEEIIDKKSGLKKIKKRKPIVSYFFNDNIEKIILKKDWCYNPNIKIGEISDIINKETIKLLNNNERNSISNISNNNSIGYNLVDVNIEHSSILGVLNIDVDLKTVFEKFCTEN